MSASKASVRVLILTMITVSGSSYIGTNNDAFATSNQFESHTMSGIDLNNNPMVAKILAEIQYSKQQIAELQKNKKDQTDAEKQIAQQRMIAKQLQDRAYEELQLNTAQNNTNSYDRFLNSVQDNDTKLVFHGEIAFTQQRIDAGHIAMQKIIASGGTWDEAIQEFSKYAAIRYTEMIAVNQELNDKYIHHTPIPGMPTAPIPFDKYGKVPDDYIKLPSSVTDNART